MFVYKDAKRHADGEAVETEPRVRAIMEDVRSRGDGAVLDYTERFDGYRPQNIRVSPEGVKAAYDEIPPDDVETIRFSARRIEDFARRQLATAGGLRYEISPGVTLGHRLIPVKSCGCYVPAGRYPLPSSALMSIIPARVAGVGRIAAASPASGHGIHPAVLVAMDIAGAGEIYCMGGAQAVAAFAFGTESVAKVDMIVGPGNRYVTEAKRQCTGIVGIDMLAGPSESLIIADWSADPKWIAADAVSCCEHDSSSWSTVLLPDRKLADAVTSEIDSELGLLGTSELAAQTWRDNGRIIIFDSLDEAAEMSDAIAPEHLQIMTSDSPALAGRVSNFGSLFIGPYAPVPFGDYVSGPNHILPTQGCARFSGGVNALTFVKVASFQEITAEGALWLSPRAARFAALEGLDGHKRSAELRGA